MLKILSSTQVRNLDQFTIDHEPIAPIDLMERACQSFTDWFAARFSQDKKIGIVCGPGNNGGDGLGIARMLLQLGYPIKVWIVKGGLKESDSFKKNLEKIRGKADLFEITKSSDKGLFSECDILIDALFGSGLSRAVDGTFLQAITCVNQSGAIRISVDIPSGLFMDSHTEGATVQAQHTVSFQLPKLAFFLPENQDKVGQWHLVDIGLSEAFIDSIETQNTFVTARSIKKIVRPRKTFSHKGVFGHALLIAGSFGQMGACVLAAKAALRSGVGLLTVHVPNSGNFIVQTSVPEAMTSVDVNDNYFSGIKEVLNYSAIGIGPGLGIESSTVNAFAKTLEDFKKPMIIDADGLNILSANPALLKLIPERSILTPHPKEFERLAGGWKDDFERLELLRAFAHRTKSIIVLKGAFSSIAFPDGQVYFNSTGNPGMATGGSGDVLTGILTGLLAQGYSSQETALLGVYLHGLAGDLASVELGVNSMIASDIVHKIPHAFIKLNRV